MPGFGGGVIGGAVVDLVLNDTGFNAGLTQAEAKLKGVSSSATGFAGYTKAAFLVAGTAAVAFGAISVKAYMQHQAALVALQNVISKTPAMVGMTAQAFDDQAKAIALATGADRDQILAADTVLSQFKLTGAQIQQIIPLVVDYATRTGQDVPTAASNLGKALLGNTRALKTIGIDFKATGNTAKDFATIMADLQQKVGGAAAAYGQTFAGQLDRFKQSVNDVAIEVGQELLPVVSDLLKVFQFLLPVVSAIAQNFIPLLAVFLGFKAIAFLPALLEATAAGLEAIGAEKVATGIISAGAAIDGLVLSMGPMVAVTLAAVAAWTLFEGVTGKTPSVIGSAATALAGLVAQQQGLVPSADASAAALRAEGIAVDADTGAIRNNTLAKIANRQATEALAGGVLGAESAMLAAQQATESYNQAVAKLNKDVKSGHASAATLRADRQAVTSATVAGIQAQLNLNQAITSYAATLTGPVKTAQDAVTKDIADMGGAVDKTNKHYAQYLVDLAALQAAQQGLAPAQQKAIGQLEALGAKMGLTKGQVDKLIAGVLGLSNSIDGLPSSKNINITTHYTTVGSPPGGYSYGTGQNYQRHAAGAVFPGYAGGMGFVGPSGPFVAGEGAYPTMFGTGGEIVSNRGVMPLTDSVIAKLGAAIAQAGGGIHFHGPVYGFPDFEAKVDQAMSAAARKRLPL